MLLVLRRTHAVGLRAGQTIVIFGASGGVGSAGVQLAKRRGAKVVAIAGGSKLQAVADLGADYVIVRDLDDIQSAAVEVAGARPHVVFDVVGGDDLRRSFTNEIDGPRCHSGFVWLGLRLLSLADSFR